MQLEKDMYLPRSMTDQPREDARWISAIIQMARMSVKSETSCRSARYLSFAPLVKSFESDTIGLEPFHVNGLRAVFGWVSGRVRSATELIAQSTAWMRNGRRRSLAASAPPMTGQMIAMQLGIICRRERAPPSPAAALAPLAPLLVALKLSPIMDCDASSQLLIVSVETPVDTTSERAVGDTTTMTFLSTEATDASSSTGFRP